MEPLDFRARAALIDELTGGPGTGAPIITARSDNRKPTSSDATNGGA